MLPEVAGWRHAHPATLRIAFISQGSIGENPGASEHGIDNVLLRRGREIADAYQIYGTSSAVLISVAGMFGRSGTRNGNERAKKNGVPVQWRGGIAAPVPGMALMQTRTQGASRIQVSRR
ncbi:MAG: hypothetical protein ABI884_02910 [Gemmatimonadota bacterium]